MKGKITDLTPMLETNDLPGTIDFYTNILGFKKENDSFEEVWVLLSRDRIDLMFTVPNAERGFKSPVMSGSLYFSVEEVDPIWDELKDKCKVCYPIENFEYGMREFAIYDNNGYLLQFAMDISELS